MLPHNYVTVFKTILAGFAVPVSVVRRSANHRTGLERLLFVLVHGLYRAFVSITDYPPEH